MEFKTHLCYLAPWWYRPWSNYRYWSVYFDVPIYGHRINEWLRNRRIKTYGIPLTCDYVDSCNTVGIVFRWYKREYLKRK